MKKFISDNKGNVVVEMAMVLPVFILLVLAIMEFGRVFSGYIELQNSARDLVRYAAVNDSMKTIEDAQDWIRDNRIVLLKNKEKLIVTSFSRPETTVNGQKHKWVKLDVIYDMEILTPVIQEILGNPYRLRAHMGMRSE